MKIIAEIGWNHMGDMDLAKKMISLAAENGADICKFQTWSEKDLKPGPWDTDGRREIYKKAQLSNEQHIELKDYCSTKNIIKLNSKKIILMHCVSTYPCEPKLVNFPRMEKIKKYSTVFGYSGHLSGIEDAMIALVKGASYVEKHFTIDKNLPGRDNKFAILPNDLKKLSNFRDQIKEMNIDNGLDLQECEKDIFNNYRGRWSKN